MCVGQIPEDGRTPPAPDGRPVLWLPPQKYFTRQVPLSGQQSKIHGRKIPQE